MKSFKIIFPALFFPLLTLITGCKKLIAVDPPKYSLTEDKVYKDDSSAVAVLLNIYTRLSSASPIEENITTRSGMCADELTTTIDGYFQFTNNAIQPDDFSIKDLWNGLYAGIYSANLLLENLERSPAITEITKRQLKGEAKFLRGFSYFYLTNLWGDVPLLLSSRVETTSAAARTLKEKVYEQIVADLKEAQELLMPAYPAGEKIRVNKFAATALLARAYLYLQDWKNAETQATTVIESTLYTPLPSLSAVFAKNSKETILQWWRQNGYTGLGPVFIPPAGAVPTIQVSETLGASIETGDNRKAAWIGSAVVAGQPYYYPFKYKQRSTGTGNNAEYSVVLRAAEVYLIRAEARAQQGETVHAVEDLNIIRARSGLAPLPLTLSKENCLTAVEKERRTELAFEWGHRWLDLKRTGKAQEVLSPLKAGWKPTALQFPIPQQEINRNPRLVQNAGY